MYLNTFLIMFGLNPDDFINELVEPYKSDSGSIIYNLRQRTDKRICPECGCIDALIKDYYYTNTRFTTNDGLVVIIRIKRVRFKCKTCNKTFVIPIQGIERYGKISKQVRQLIIKEFIKQKSFALIGQDYNISSMQVMYIFDEEYPYIQRGKLSEAMCIDEISFKTEEGSYAAILYDHDKRIIIDVIKNRQAAYLDDYFSHCSFYERSKVKFFISDLYEGYVTVKEKFFRDAVHIADMFHVIRLLKTEVSRLRVRTYKEHTEEGDIERTYMKLHWENFEKYMTAEDLNEPYYSRKEKMQYTNWYIMKNCLSLDMAFWDAYSILQELLGYYKYRRYEDCLEFIDRISSRLINTGHEDLIRVGTTYKEWRHEIANALHYKNELNKRYSNGPAEGLNNSIKTVIKDANGYRNFERFRKRLMLVVNKGKDPAV